MAAYVQIQYCIVMECGCGRMLYMQITDQVYFSTHWSTVDRCRLTVGRPSADRQQTIGRQSADCHRLSVDTLLSSTVGRQSVNGWLSVSRPTVGWLSYDEPGLYTKKSGSFTSSCKLVNRFCAELTSSSRWGCVRCKTECARWWALLYLLHHLKQEGK